jgi:large subunit ribosomal protein L3
VSFPGLIGKKHGMTQIFDEEGNAVAVTVVELLPMTVTQVKTSEHDGYNAIQIGVVSAKEKHLTKAEAGHLSKNSLPLVRVLQEFRVSKELLATFTAGTSIDPSFVQDGQYVNVTGHSIGKGFQGNTRRWGHHRGPMSHGSKSHRLPGSIGAGTTPGRVFKGQKMAGKTGNETVTVKNLIVVRYLADKNVLLISGSVPGVEGGLLTLNFDKALKPKKVS